MPELVQKTRKILRDLLGSPRRGGPVPGGEGSRSGQPILYRFYLDGLPEIVVIHRFLDDVIRHPAGGFELDVIGIRKQLVAHSRSLSGRRTQFEG